MDVSNFVHETVDFFLLLVYVFLKFLFLLLVIRGPLLLLLSNFVQFFLFFALFAEHRIAFFQIVYILRQNVNIGVERVVLFFTLYEGVRNFRDVCDSTSVFYRSEGIVDNH